MFVSGMTGASPRTRKRLAAVAAVTALLAALPAVDVSGAIFDQAWVLEKRLKALPGSSGSLGYDRTIPARMGVILG